MSGAWFLTDLGLVDDWLQGCTLSASLGLARCLSHEVASFTRDPSLSKEHLIDGTIFPAPPTSVVFPPTVVLESLFLLK